METRSGAPAGAGGQARALHEVPRDVTGLVRLVTSLLIDGDEEREALGGVVLAMLTAFRGWVVAGLVEHVDLLARQAAREEAQSILRAGRVTLPDVSEDEGPSSKPGGEMAATDLEAVADDAPPEMVALADDLIREGIPVGTLRAVVEAERAGRKLEERASGVGFGKTVLADGERPS